MVQILDPLGDFQASSDEISNRYGHCAIFHMQQGRTAGAGCCISFRRAMASAVDHDDQAVVFIPAGTVDDRLEHRGQIRRLLFYVEGVPGWDNPIDGGAG